MCETAKSSSNARHRLPDRRASETFEIRSESLIYLATVSCFEDGSPGEIFLTNNKPGVLPTSQHVMPRSPAASRFKTEFPPIPFDTL